MASDSSCKPHVLDRDGHTLGMEGAKVSVFHETNDVGLGSLLKSKDGIGSKPKVTLVILCDLLDQPLERKLPDQKIHPLLVPSDLLESDRARSVPPRLIHNVLSNS